MSMNRRAALAALSAGTAALAASGRLSAREPPPMIDPGPFAPKWNSFIDGYRTPDWYRDAKFGIWAHWGPQSMPELGGGWFARAMYEQGTEEYEWHLKRYGHPADTGYMDMLRDWNPSKLDTDALANTYRKAGARFLVALAVHHDNFDLYASRYHQWNSVQIGPRRDLLGEWARSARSAGLTFGMSSHSSEAWHWFTSAYGYDPVGPRLGERYDAATRFKNDGAGTWWDGLDPQLLYAASAMATPDGLTRTEDVLMHNKLLWHRLIDATWIDGAPKPPREFVRNWYLRTKDAIDRYGPDFIYFDNANVPLGQAGLDIVAHHYNRSIRQHGELRAVVTGNFLDADRCKGITYNKERGMSAMTLDRPWSAVSCIGRWFYVRELYEKRLYRSSKSVINNLVDIVSKNGTYLLSVPIRGDGSIDSEEERILDEIGQWLSAYGAAIYGTRPWRQFGEGPTQIPEGFNGEARFDGFTHRDIRYTAKGSDLYAITMGAIPDGMLTAGLLGSDALGRPIRSVSLVGSGQPVPFVQEARALRITLPPAANIDPGCAVLIRS